jgi:hypothetical protein
MDCYKDFSPSRQALFAMGGVSFPPSFLGASLIRHLFNNWLRVMPVRSSLRFSRHITPNVQPPKQ